MYPTLPVYKFIPYIQIINKPIEKKNAPSTLLELLSSTTAPIPIIIPA